jgi:RNA polymerase sigma-70 factor (ECF subfamily)
MERYKNDLLHFLIRFVGTRAAAEDVFQETFLQIHISASTFDPTRRFKPWLFTIAANKGRDWHRKHSKRTVMSLSQEVGGDGEGARFVDLMESEQDLPDAKILDSEQTDCIRAAVDELPSHLREILLLSYFQQMSYLQIAESLQIPLGTVKSRLHAAVATFSNAWQSANNEEAA